MLVHAYATSPRKAKWSGPHHTTKILNFMSFHSVRWYTHSRVSRIHVNTTKLRNITCTLIATVVIIQIYEYTRFVVCAILIVVLICQHLRLLVQGIRHTRQLQDRNRLVTDIKGLPMATTLPPPMANSY
jgi:hypothetical protein